MKVLFAVNNENISEAIVKKYQRNFKEIISYKNVYYFNAILKELQKDKSYDRIVISEDLEQFTNTSYEQMDKFIFEKLDSISDEASNMKGEDVPIILICTERRAKAEEILVKFFGIGVYNAIIGGDRSIDEVCRLINKPRSKKEAKAYYKIDSEDVSYRPENENDVSEVELQNIIAHFQRIGKDEEKYLTSYDSIAAQYNDNQLRVISKYLPLNVRAVLEERSPKYQQVMAFNRSVSESLRNKNQNQKTGPSEILLNSKKREMLSNPIVVPASMKSSAEATKLARPKKIVKVEKEPEQKKVVKAEKKPQEVKKIDEVEAGIEPIQEVKQTAKSVKKVAPVEKPVDEQVQQVEETPKKRRGRPRKNPVPEPVVEVENKLKEEETLQETPKKRRGRPRKNPIPEPVAEVNEAQEDKFASLLEEIENSSKDSEKAEPEIEKIQEPEEVDVAEPEYDDEDDEAILPGFEEDYDDYGEQADESIDKYGEEQDSETNEENYEDYEDNYEDAGTLPGVGETEEDDYEEDDYYDDDEMQPIQPVQPIAPQPMQRNINEKYVSDGSIRSLLTFDKRLVAFVGTGKNGTSFIVNNLAESLSQSGVDVAILDTTQNKNSYYIYTKNEEALRKTAMSSISNLARGVADGIKVRQNLTVYTSLPGEGDELEDVREVLTTLVKMHTVVLIDCDFSTPKGYFAEAQELYLVQTMDVLTIQPLTAFLKDLIYENVVKEDKLRIIINKYVRIRGVREKEIVGGMSKYNEPAMSFMTDLFDKDKIRYLCIPFEEEIYTKYLEGIINCEITLKGYSKTFMQNLRQLQNMIYPIAAGKKGYNPPTVNNNGFSSNMNNTLDQMRRF